LRFERPPYSLFLLLQAFTIEHYPALQQNYYVLHEQMPEVHRKLLNIVYCSVTKNEFNEMMDLLKQIGI